MPSVTAQRRPAAREATGRAYAGKPRILLRPFRPPHLRLR